MDNITTLDPFWREAVVTENSQHVMGVSTSVHPHTTSRSALDVYNSTHTNWTTPGQNDPLTRGLWMYLVVRVLSGVLAIAGNSLTLLAVVRFERLQTCTNYLICSLAVSDMLAGVMVPLVLVHEVYPSSSFFIPVCLCQQIVALISSGGNLLNILYLSIDRYVYIAFPLRYHGLITPRKILIILSVTWINFLFTVPTLILTANHLQVGMACRFHIFLNKRVQAFYMFPQLFVIFTSTIGFHLAIAKIAYKQGRQIAAEQHPYNTLDVAINQSTRKISCTLGLVLGVYIFAFIPAFILGVITSNNEAYESYDIITITIYWANTWVNPLIYTWRLKDFKIAFKKIFTGTGSFIEVPGMVA